MKQNDFLKKLVLENNLSIVEPSINISNSYSEKSKSNFDAASLLLSNNFLEESVSLFYYSMYNKLLSLLFLVGIKSENHTASIILLSELFDLDSSLISAAKKERISSQYYVDSDVVLDSVSDLRSDAINFIDELDFFIDSSSSPTLSSLRLLFKNIYFS